MRIAFFTAGTVGAGHAVRGIAIAHALARLGAKAEYATFGPRGEDLRLPLPSGHHAVAIDAAELRDPARAKGSEVARALAAFAPDVLLVDLFWAPLLHVLPLAACEAWLLVRRAPRDWLVGPPGHRMARDRFARVIAIEPGTELDVDEAIDPIVIANPDERRAPGALRDALGVARGERLAIAHHAGKPGEHAAVARAIGDRPLHLFTLRDERAPLDQGDVRPHDGAPFFPLAAWLHDADAIASGAGYNAYWESRWMGLDARATFVAFPRDLDDQAWRARACGRFTPRSNGADVIARRLTSGR